MARRTRITKAKPKTPETARSLLISRGCDPGQLDFLIFARRYLLPTHPDQVFKHSGPKARYLNRLDARIDALEKDLRNNTWTEEGKQFVGQRCNQGWMFEEPDTLRRYRLHLKAIRLTVNKRRPLTLDHINCTLVKYVWDATGGKHGWHDAELALLCNVERPAWRKWRVKHYQPPPPPTVHRAEVIGPQDAIKPIDL